MSLKSKLFKGSTLNVVEQFAMLAAAFIITPVLIRALGMEGYGLWIAAMAFFGQYALLDFGLPFAVARYVAHASGEKNPVQISRIATNASILFVIGAFISLIVSLTAYAFCPWFMDDPDKISLLRFVILVYAVVWIGAFLTGTCRGVLKAYLRYDLLVYASLCQILVVNIALYYFLTRDHGLRTLTLITAAGFLLKYLLVLWFCRRAAPEARFNRSLINRQTGKDLLQYGAYQFLITVSQKLGQRIDPLIIGGFVGLGPVALYAIGARLANYLVDFIGCFAGGTMLSLFSHYEGQGDRHRRTEKLFLLVRLNTILTVFCGASMIFYGQAFIERWLGPELKDAYPVLVLLTVAGILHLVQAPTGGAIYAIGKHKVLAWMFFYGGLGNLAVSLILVQHLGLYGVVVGTVLETLVVRVFIYPRVACRLLDIPLSTYCASLVVTFIKTVLCLLTVFLPLHFLLGPSYAALISVGFLQLCLSLPLLYIFVLQPEDRTLLTVLLSSISKRESMRH